MTVRPSAPQGHQYEVAYRYTGYNPVLNPVFLARNRTVTRVVAKQAKTTNVKNKFVNGKKSLKEYSVVFLVEGEKNWAIKFRRKVQICLVGFVANSVGTPLEFAAFCSRFDAKYSRASTFWSFLSTTMVLRRSEHILLGKTPAFLC